jgi:transposase
MKPMKLITLAKRFIKNIEQELKLEVTTKICDGELDLEKMQLRKLEKIMEDYALWKEYRDQMESQRVS